MAAANPGTNQSRKKLPLRGAGIPFTGYLFAALAVLCLFTWMSPPLALLLGLIATRFTGHPYERQCHKLSQWLLQAAVVGLGLGMNATQALKAGREGFLFTVISITGTLLTGLLLARLLKIDKKTSYMISAGSAICGGSAIASISPAIRAEEKQISVALGTVFILNSVALFLFPFVARQLHLTPAQFGLWCAIAIHDTSSVVGAAARFGSRSLEIATTVKMARALWIIPVALLSSLLFKNKGARVKIPYFIGFFVLAVAANTYLRPVQAISAFAVSASRSVLTLTLFLIGSGISADALRSVGFRPLIQGLILWILISVSALAAILYLHS